MYVSVMQVRNSECFVFDQWTGVRRSGDCKRFGTSGAYSGQVTSGSAKRLSKAIGLLVQISPPRWIWNPVSQNHHNFRLGFVTLTTSNPGTDTAKETYEKCLSKWLRWARGAGMKNYVWKAELQARGAIHYHVATDCFLHYQEVQDKWNQAQKNAGYLDDFARKNHHFRPNSTDVHSVRKVKDIERYLGKYMAKGGGSITGKVWDASTTLKQSPYFSTEVTPDNISRLRKICTEEKRGEFATLFKIPPGHARHVLDATQKSEYFNFLSTIKL